MTTDERSLATWLATRDDAALAETFALRSVSPSATWSDFFDAADALLDAASVDRAITRLPRPALAALAGGKTDEARAALERLALVDESGEPYAVVAERVAAVRANAPEALSAGPAPIDPPPADPAASAAAAERAFASTGALADLLIATQHTPLVAHRRGSGERGRSQAADGCRSHRLDGGPRRPRRDRGPPRGLLEATDREWTVSETAEAWLQATTIRRWALVVEGFRAALRSGLRTPERRLPRARVVARSVSARPRMARDRREDPTARRTVGARVAGRRRAGVGAVAACGRTRRRRRASPRSSPPRSTASTCRPT